METNNEILEERICKYCGKTFYVKKSSNAVYCSDECRKKVKENYYRDYCLKHRNAATKDLNENAIEGIDYVECPICHEKHSQLTLTHFKRHGYTSTEQIFKDFPNLQMTRKKQINENLKGENNPMSKIKTTKLFRQQCSPYSLEHYIKLYNGDIDMAKQKLQEFLNSIDRTGWNENTRINYYLNQGMSIEEAQNCLKNRQTTNGIDYYINKYGEINGIKKYNDRIDKWCKKLQTGQTRSHKADKCIYEIIGDEIDYLMFGDNEFSCKSPDTNNHYKIDLTNLKNKKMIEFFGDYWHCNPIKYSENYIRKNRSAKDVWEYDNKKIDHLKKLGFDIMIIWEYDYTHNHDYIIDKAKKFIFNYEK